METEEDKERNPFLKTNTLLSREFQTQGKSRPFSTINHDTDEKTITLKLFLLPHQYIILPPDFQDLAQLDDDLTVHGIDTIR